MTEFDRKKFAELLGEIMIFYRQPLSVFALDVWWQACQPFGLDQVRRALTQHAIDPDRGQFAPKPADVVRQIAGSAADRAQSAWTLALQTAATLGRSGEPGFDDPVLREVIDGMGGWFGFCAGETTALEPRFLRAYSAIAQKRGAPVLSISGAGEAVKRLAA
jgi:hypothetical protein